MLHERKIESLRKPSTAAVIAAALAVGGCSSVSLPSMPSLAMPSLPWSTPSIKDNASAEVLYKEGVQLLAEKKYVPAIERFQKLRSDYPFAPELISAELKLGEAYYFNKQYTEAVETLKEFEALHPSNENLPYALYIEGMAHFDQFSSADRDQKLTEIAKGYFERIVNNYPKSEYAPKAQEKLAKCREYLAEHEYDIASYYMREKKYPAARDRFEGIVRRYRTTSVAPKALYQLGETYRQEKNNVKAALAFEALTQHYPNDPLAKNARAQLTAMAQEKQDPLAALLKREPRDTVVAQKAPESEDKLKDTPRVAKTEVVDEKPGDEKTMFDRVVDKINPFSSSSSPAPAKEAEKKQTAKSSPRTVSTQSAQLIGSIDESLSRREGGAKSADPAPPAPDLPSIAETNLPMPNEAATLSAIDGRLDKKGAAVAALPPTPEAAPILKTPLTQQERVAGSTRPTRPLPNESELISDIDSKLKRQGIDTTPAEEAKLALPQAQKPVATPRPKTAAPDKVLEPRMTTEKGPLFLPQQDAPKQDKAPEPATATADSAAPAPAPTLPELAVKGPPQQQKAAAEKIAKAKTDEDVDPEDKGVFDQLKEDLGRVGKLLNPFSW
jgi:outer membrane protein assembly factor BamD